MTSAEPRPTLGRLLVRSSCRVRLQTLPPGFFILSGTHIRSWSCISAAGLLPLPADVDGRCPRLPEKPARATFLARNVATPKLESPKKIGQVLYDT